jgi:pyridoxine 5-phosphate synthase
MASNKSNLIQLGVNVDHVATLRQARGERYPDPIQAADVARKAGADGITIHLREDRRHIVDEDVYAMKEKVALPLNLEMAATEEMLQIACEVSPHEVCLVPEKREELTTEGGLNVLKSKDLLKEYCAELKAKDILISLFIDPEKEQIECSREVGADIIELHTGEYAKQGSDELEQLSRIKDAAHLGQALGLQVNAGHGLHYQNVQKIAEIPSIVCLNIGHSIVSRAVFSGMHDAVFSMKQEMINARLAALDSSR